MSVPHEKKEIQSLSSPIGWTISNFQFNFLISVIQTHVTNGTLCRAKLPVPRGFACMALSSVSMGSQGEALRNTVSFCRMRFCINEPGEHRGSTHHNQLLTHGCQHVVRLWTEELGTQLLTAPVWVRSLPPANLGQGGQCNCYHCPGSELGPPELNSVLFVPQQHHSAVWFNRD